MSDLLLERDDRSAAPWEDEEARQRALFREANERIAELGLTFRNHGHLQLVCECGDGECTQPIELTVAEYEAVRSHARRFVVAKDHEDPTLEIVVGEGARFAVVETLVGEASRIAEETDPRASTLGEQVDRARQSAASAS